ncbi:DUF998 domain-containing protein [Actinomadura sp. GC306]|uniref:DUF998 domain-containing protein n=1 Tax=Actinomadura sp. GC306 TaxID=2530367 RepID=UPI0010509AFB|nr:DUF998 domain-containing protein [Actinomadura sp. GC306]TDC61763.1 DUF998 domain-containing protein [Actinomadura sp. GC306]
MPSTQTTSLSSSRATRALLACGVPAGPLFVLLIVAQAMTRDGFDAARHPLSMLALGEHGWIQTVNFLLCGALAAASAAGLRRVLEPGTTGRTWGTALIGVYGASLIWAGLFPTDPAEGFPAGTPDGVAEVTWHGMLHNFAPVGMGLALSIACVVFARRFVREGRLGWTIYSAAAPAAYLVLGMAAFPLGDFRLMLAGGAAIWTWAAVLSLKFLRESHDHS